MKAASPVLLAILSLAGVPRAHSSSDLVPTSSLQCEGTLLGPSYLAVQQSALARLVEHKVRALNKESSESDVSGPIVMGYGDLFQSLQQSFQDREANYLAADIILTGVQARSSGHPTDTTAENVWRASEAFAELHGAPSELGTKASAYLAPIVAGILPLRPPAELSDLVSIHKQIRERLDVGNEAAGLLIDAMDLAGSSVEAIYARYESVKGVFQYAENEIVSARLVRALTLKRSSTAAACVDAFRTLRQSLGLNFEEALTLLESLDNFDPESVYRAQEIFEQVRNSFPGKSRSALAVYTGILANFPAESVESIKNHEIGISMRMRRVWDLR